jgi:hypothetical protein
MAIEGIEGLELTGETRDGVSEFLDEPIDSLIDDLMLHLDISRTEALAVCLFDIANRINWQTPHEINQMTLRTESLSNSGRFRVTRFGNDQVVPSVTDFDCNRIT